MQSQSTQTRFLNPEIRESLILGSCVDYMDSGIRDSSVLNPGIKKTGIMDCKNPGIRPTHRLLKPGFGKIGQDPGIAIPNRRTLI